MAPTLQTTPFQRRVLTATVSLCGAIVAMDMTIAGVILPVMQGSLKANMQQMSWIMTSYIVAGAIMTPLSGALTAPFGRKTVIICSLSTFIVTSFMCGLATDLNQMVFYRILQGAAGAALTPLSQSVIFDLYEQKDHQRAYGWFALGIMGGPMIGPVVGGYLTEILNWRWVFFINVPIAGAALALIFVYMPTKERVRSLRFDYLGFALLAICIACLQLVLDRGVGEDWFTSTEIILETLIAVAALYFFLVHMMTEKKPFLDLDLFKDTNYVSGLLVMFAASFAMIVPMVLVPTFLQDLQGRTVIDAGLLLAPRGIGFALGIVLAPRMLALLSPRYVCLSGSFLISYGLIAMTNFNLEVGPWPVIYTGFTQGLGMGLVVIPVSTIALGSLPPRLRDQAAALFQLMRSLGSSLGIALGVTVMTVTSDTNLIDLYSFYTELNPGLGDAAGGLWSIENPQGLFLLKMELTRQARMIGFQNAFIVMFLAGLITIPFILRFQTPNELSSSRRAYLDTFKRLKSRAIGIFQSQAS